MGLPPLLTDDEIRDWRTRLEALKTFTEGLTPYNTVGKLKNLRIGSDDIDAQKKNLEVLAAVEKLLELGACYKAEDGVVMYCSV